MASLNIPARTGRNPFKGVFPNPIFQFRPRARTFEEPAPIPRGAGIEAGDVYEAKTSVLDFATFNLLARKTIFS